MLLEALCAIGLIMQCARSAHGKALYIFTAIGVVLTAQAMLLRALGPAGTMTVFDAFDLRWPAVISLFWASLGAALTLVARRIPSRTVWSIGATAMVACAIKVVLLDFGSLGELENILAVIAAGAIFMLVSWLAPLPPKDEERDNAQQFAA
jgi:hypothetical protein